MKVRFFVLAVLVCLAAATARLDSQTPPVVAKTNLKVGDVAPDFTLPDQNRKPVNLNDFRGKKNVILVFYVMAFSPN